MKYTIPKEFDGSKFATRYGLKSYRGLGIVQDFWIDGDGMLNVRDDIKLPDDPPIFEAPDTVKPKTIEDRVKALEKKLGG